MVSVVRNADLHQADLDVILDQSVNLELGRFTNSGICSDMHYII